MIDLKLDTTTHDLVIEKGDLSLVKAGNEVAQNLKERLLFILGEWFLDTTVGIPYFESIWIKNPNPDLVDDIFKSAIQETDDVIELLEFSSSFDTQQRKYSVSFKVNTTFGELSLQGLTV